MGYYPFVRPDLESLVEPEEFERQEVAGPSGPSRETPPSMRNRNVMYPPGANGGIESRSRVRRSAVPNVAHVHFGRASGHGGAPRPAL